MVTRRILGIDPGSRVTGYGILEQRNDGQLVCLTCGCLALIAKSMPLRLSKLFVGVKDIVDKFNPTELAIEAVFVQKNALSALKLGQARGVAIAAVMSYELPVYEYAPRQVKQAIVGKGNADKSQIQHMIQILLSLQEKPEVDAADALAIALCHLHSVNCEQRISSLPRRRKNKRSIQWKQYDRTTSRDLD